MDKMPELQQEGSKLKCRGNCQKVSILVAAMILMLLGSGFIFGWASLLAILEKEDAYVELCPNNIVCLYFKHLC